MTETSGLVALLGRISDRAAGLRAEADSLINLASTDAQVSEAIGTAPWKLRRQALALEELATRVNDKYEKILERDTGASDGSDQE